jgi:predicted lipoprotein with Yx(FWY)xxD motif
MRPTLKILIPALAVSLTLAACGSSSNSSSSSSQASTASSSSGASADAVRTAANATLGSTVLVSAQGRTLYHLSGEQDGKFLCTSAACVATWPPVSASAISAGVSGLETVRRPDGGEQLAYKGEPLYTFAGDKAAGEANGQGVKADGGTWSAVVAAASSASVPQTTSTSEPAVGYHGS